MFFSPVFLILAGGTLHIFENPFTVASFKILNPSAVKCSYTSVMVVFLKGRISNENALNAFKILAKRLETIGFFFEIAL